MLSPRIPRAVSKRPPRVSTRINRGHLAFIRSLPCAVCGLEPKSEAAHIRSRTDGGTGLKPSDKWTVPLCRAHHAEQHAIGEVEFFGSRRIDAHALAERLWRVSGDIDQGRRAIERARQGR